MSEGVDTYLLLVDPDTLTVLWANDKVEEAIASRTGTSAVGQRVEDVVYLAEQIGVVDLIRDVGNNGLTRHISAVTFRRSRTDASLYRLPSGEVLVASQWVQIP